MIETPLKTNEEKIELTYKELIKNRYRNVIVLAKELENTLGKEQAHKIIRNAFYKEMKQAVKKELTEIGPVNSFQDFVRIEKEENETTEFKNLVSLSYPSETSSELSLHVDECLYANIFKELDAESLGYLMVCNPDHAYAQACNPSVKLRRTKTLMEGDSHCNHTWYWNESESE
jgi:hypothetical protein